MSKTRMFVAHEKQRNAWNTEHAYPYALAQMDKREPSGAVAACAKFLKGAGINRAVGIEMGCGKGRNVIALSKESFVSKMYGFDFSEVAIAEAKKRASEQKVSDKTDFWIMDATQPWEHASNFYDVGIDCAASTDIETPEGRRFAIDEMFRVLKSGGYFLAYVMSTDDEYHALMRARSSAEEPNAFYHPETGKFEKVFSEDELNALHSKFNLIEKRRLHKTVRFFGAPYASHMHWRIYQKPLQ